MKELPPRSVLKKVAIRLVPVSVFILAGCSGGGVGEKNSSSQELENRESGYSLPFPEGETWFLTNGPHADGWSNGIKYGIDIAPPEGGDCKPFGVRRSIDSRVVTASASGEVIAKGDDKNRNDLHHSEIRIKDRNGLTQAYIHLDNTKKVKVGNKVKQGDPLGNPSCEYPPGGANTGPHVHVGLMKDGQAIPIDGAVVGGWTIHEGADGEDGTMTKPGEKTRTANVGRFGENSTGIRNDLPNNPNRAVVASPKNPIPPISATITSKKAESPTPTPIPSVEKSVETSWTRFKSPTLDYQIDYPSEWIAESIFEVIRENDTGMDTDNPFIGELVGIDSNRSLYAGIRIVANSAPRDLDLDTYREQMIDQLQRRASPGDLRIKVPEAVYVDGQKAWKIEHEMPNGHGVYYLFIKEEKAWKIAFGSHASVFDKELPRFEKILASFRFLPSPATSKEVFTVAPTPTPTAIPTRRPTEIPRPTLAPQRKIPTPTPTSVPTLKPTETPKPVEKPKTIEEQAQKASLSYFLGLLDSTQKIASPFDRGGKVELTSSFSITGRTAAEHQSLLEGRQILQDSDLIKTTWIYSEPEGGNDRVTKNFGQAEIKNIKLNTFTIPVDNADKANGIQWKGAVQMTFIDRYRIVKPWFNWGGYYFSEYGLESMWEKANVPEPTIPFTQWENGVINVSMLFKNGTWQIQSQSDGIRYPISSFDVGRWQCQPWKTPVDGCQVAPIQIDAMRLYE